LARREKRQTRRERKQERNNMAQYRIDYVPDVPMTDINGEPAYKLIGVRQTGQPVYEADAGGEKILRSAVQLSFMLGRVTEPKFVEGLSAMAGVCLVVETSQELKKQAAAAKARGFWLLDKDPAERLKAATEEPRSKEQVAQGVLAYDIATAHNFFPAMTAIKDMCKHEPAAVEKTEESKAAE